jgi:hypothetical protein
MSQKTPKPALPPTPPRPDPLIDEVRAIRKSISDQSGNDVNKLCDRLQEIQAKYHGRVIRKPPPRRDGKVA